jgi:hypothetical protein
MPTEPSPEREIRMQQQLPGRGRLIFAPPASYTYPSPEPGTITHLCSTPDCAGVFTTGTTEHPDEIAHVTFRCAECHAHSVICLGDCASESYAEAAG